VIVLRWESGHPEEIESCFACWWHGRLCSYHDRSLRLTLAESERIREVFAELRDSASTPDRRVMFSDALDWLDSAQNSEREKIQRARDWLAEVQRKRAER